MRTALLPLVCVCFLLIGTAKAQQVPTPVVTGILSEYCNNHGIQSGKLTNIPVPNTGITTLVKLGLDTLPVAGDSTFSFNTNFLSVGLHKIMVTYKSADHADTLNMNFSIRYSIAPDVDISANITSFSDLVDPIVITARNTAGGGNFPLYTFANDRTFNSLLQEEGSNSILNINPSNLQVGKNWIYVRMKSDLPCRSTPTNVDSILLSREATTPVVNQENTGEGINTYPNPFPHQVTVNGLMPSKNYEVSIIGLDGRLLLRKQLQQVSQLTLPLTNYTPGIYFLKLYDKGSRRVLSSMRIVKM